jgi:hypothetical protein
MVRSSNIISMAVVYTAHAADRIRNEKEEREVRK